MMKAFFKSVSVVMATLLLMSLFTFGALAAPAEGVPLATAVYGTPAAIDGVLDGAWNSANTYACEKNGEANKTDIAMSWRVMYDETYLYFFAEVKDSTIGTKDQEYCEYVGDYWTKNTVQFYLDMGYERTANTYDGNDFRFDVNSREWFFCHCISAAGYVEYGVKMTSDGYNVEVSVDTGIYPEFKAEEGTCVGFDIWAGDNIVTEPGRKDFKLWTGNTDAYCNAASLGTIQLGAKSSSSGKYNGIHKGTYLPKLGATLTGITNAENKDVSIITNGIKANFENVDTFGATYTDDLGVWFGLDFGKDYDIKQVVFWEGGHWNDGGWFGAAPKLQCFVNGEWKDCEFTLSPAYPADNRDAQGFTHEPYYFDLENTVTCSKVRVVAAKNTFAGHASCCEIEAYGYEAGKTPSENESNSSNPTVSNPIASGSSSSGNSPTTSDGVMIAVGFVALTAMSATVILNKKKTHR